MSGDSKDHEPSVEVSPALRLVLSRAARLFRLLESTDVSPLILQNEKLMVDRAIDRYIRFRMYRNKN